MSCPRIFPGGEASPAQDTRHCAKVAPPAPARVPTPEQKNLQKEPERLAEREPPQPTPAEQKPEPPKPDNKTDNPKAEAVDLLHQKIVDLDMGKEVEAPADAKYLAQRNNRAERETRARQTNLDMAESGKATQGSDDEEKIAHLREQRSSRAGAAARPCPTGSLSRRSPAQPCPCAPPGWRTWVSGGAKLPESADGYLAQQRLGQAGPRVIRARARPTRSVPPHPEGVRLGIR